MRKLIVKFLIIFLLSRYAAAQEYFSFTGSAEFSGMTALNELSELDSYNDLLFGISMSSRLRMELIPLSTVRAVIQGEVSYDGGYLDPAGRFEMIGLPEALSPQEENVYLSIDQAWVEWRKEGFGSSFGFLPISWGAAWLVNPSDRVNSRSLESLFGDDESGVPALTAEMALGWYFGFNAYILYPLDERDSAAALDRVRPENLPFGMKLSAYPAGWEIAGGIVRERRKAKMSNWLIGDLTGDLAGVGITAEVAMEFPGEGGWNAIDALELSLGASYFIRPFDLEVLMEYIHLGSGERESENYDVTDLLEGRDLFLAEDYLFSRLSWSGIDNLSVDLAGIFNINDLSLLLIPSLEWEPFSDIIISAGVFFAAGDSASEFGGIREILPGLFWKPWDEISGLFSVKVYY